VEVITVSENALAYYDTELITVVKRFMIQALDLLEDSEDQT
jgi:hypothetical protein